MMWLELNQTLSLNNSTESPWYILMMTSNVFFHSPVEFLMNVLRPRLVLHSAKLFHIRVCGPEPQSVQAGPSLVWFPDVLPAVGGSALLLLFHFHGLSCVYVYSLSCEPQLSCLTSFMIMSLMSAFYTSVNPGTIHVGSPHFCFQLSSPQGGVLCRHPWSCTVLGLLFS